MHLKMLSTNLGAILSRLHIQHIYERIFAAYFNETSSIWWLLTLQKYWYNNLTATWLFKCKWERLKYWLLNCLNFKTCWNMSQLFAKEILYWACMHTKVLVYSTWIFQMHISLFYSVDPIGTYEWCITCNMCMVLLTLFCFDCVYSS